MYLPEDFPNAPPKCLFRTKIWHVNIDDKGRICLSTLKPQPTQEDIDKLEEEGRKPDESFDYWNAASSLTKVSKRLSLTVFVLSHLTLCPIFVLVQVFMNIQLLLSQPNAEDPLGEAPVKQWKEEGEAAYKQKAKEWTEEYAME